MSKKHDRQQGSVKPTGQAKAEAVTETVDVKGSRLGLPAWANVRLPKAEAQKMGVPSAQSEPPPQAPQEGMAYEGMMVGGQFRLVPQEKAAATRAMIEASARANSTAGSPPAVAALQSLGVQVVDVDASQREGGQGATGVGAGEIPPSETVSLSLPRVQMDALKWLARSEGQGVMEWLYNTARRSVPPALWGALMQGRPEDELMALKASDGKVALRPPPSPSEQIELDKLDDKQRLYYQLLTFPHDNHHPCGHCRKGNLGGRSAGDTRVCANMQYTLGASCHWPAQALRNGGGCPGFAPKR